MCVYIHVSMYMVYTYVLRLFREETIHHWFLLEKGLYGNLSKLSVLKLSFFKTLL